MPRPVPGNGFFVYVDDDPDDMEFVLSSFAAHARGLEAMTFSNGSSGYQALLQLEISRQKPCLIILDINMPGMSGKELLVLLRTIPFFDDVPIILFSTSNAQSDAAFARKYNAGFLTKPLDSAQMESIADQFISHCSQAVKERISR